MLTLLIYSDGDWGGGGSSCFDFFFLISSSFFSFFKIRGLVVECFFQLLNFSSLLSRLSS